MSSLPVTPSRGTHILYAGGDGALYGAGVSIIAAVAPQAAQVGRGNVGGRHRVGRAEVAVKEAGQL